jgi:RNAse (barnase) inhibitor barstar
LTFPKIPFSENFDVSAAYNVKSLAMAIFSENEYSAFDYEILRDGGIALYRSNDYLEEDVEQLRLAGYHVYRIDCKEWKSELDMHNSLSLELSFPSYYGKNLNALNDVITDVYVPAAGGLVLVLLHFDVFAKGAGSVHPLTEALLESLSRASHQSLLTGKRFLTLVQSDEPSMSFPKLGLSAPSWNRREWLNKDRGL